MNQEIKANHIAFGMALIGITATTLGHYCEFWILGYGVSFLFAIIASLVYGGA